MQSAVSEDDDGFPDAPGPGLTLLKVKFAKCPIDTTLGVLRKKWTLLILRDIGLRKIRRFNRLLDSVPGLTPRVLSMRLKELQDEGFIRKLEDQRSPKVVRWSLTEKGYDTLPILMRLVAFSAKWHADIVFDDKRPRKLEELFRPEAMSILRKYS